MKDYVFFKVIEGDVLYLESKKGCLSFLRDSRRLENEILILATARASFVTNIMWTQVCGDIIGNVFDLKVVLQNTTSNETAQFVFVKK